MLKIPGSFRKTLRTFCSSQMYYKEKVGSILTSKLDNGVTVVTESDTFPHSVDLGILIDVGTRDEGIDHSGMLKILDQNYFKTLESPDGVRNLEMLQYFGSNLTFEYDKETMLFKSSCLHQDLESVFRIMMNCALEHRSHIFDYTQTNPNTDENGQYEFEDNILLSAFGKQSIGLPIQGLLENYNQLSSSKMDGFMNQNISLSKIYIYGGAQNHDEFCALVQDSVTKFNIKTPTKERERSHYKGGQALIEQENEEVQVGIFYPGDPWSIESIILYNVIEKIMGSTASFSTGGPGKGMHSRTSQEMLNRYHYFHSADFFVQHFQDQGLVGMKTTGPYNQQLNMVKTMAQKLKELKNPIDEIELQRSKNIFKSHIFQVLERKQSRLEEATKNMKMLGGVHWPIYEDYINKITSQKINDKLQECFKQEPTVVIQGKDASKQIHILEQVKQIIN